MTTPRSQRRVVLYTGRVQGVGFRYTTHRIAAGYPVTGYVRNLPDGRVELVAEGMSSTLDQFLSDVRQHFSGHLRGENCEQMPGTNEFSQFEIRT